MGSIAEGGKCGFFGEHIYLPWLTVESPSTQGGRVTDQGAYSRPRQGVELCQRPQNEYLRIAIEKGRSRGQPRVFQERFIDQHGAAVGCEMGFDGSQADTVAGRIRWPGQHQ